MAIERLSAELRPYLTYVRELLKSRRYGELFKGARRVLARVSRNRYTQLRRGLKRSGLPPLLRDWKVVDSKRRRLTSSGIVDSKVTITFPSPVAPVLASVVIPCFNYGRYLREAVESALNQTVTSLEVIVVDDGSTDPDTHAELLKLKEIPRVRVVRQTNQGLSTTRNNGILLAQGEYICCLDADDTMEPSYIELAVAVLEADQSVGFAYSWVRLFGDESRIWKTRDFDIECALSENHTAVSAVFRRDDWLAAGGYRPTMRNGYEDWEFWLRLASLGRRGRVIRTPMFNHRRHGRTMTHEAHAKRQEILGTIRQHNRLLFDDSRFRQWLARMSYVRPMASPFTVLNNDGVLSARDHRPHLLVLAPWLANGGAEILLLDVLSILKRNWRISIITTLLDEQEAWDDFRKVTTEIIPLQGAFELETWPEVVDHLIETRGTRLILSHGCSFAYRILPEIRTRHPNIRTVDILHNDTPGGHIRAAVSASPAIDRHIAVSGRITESLRKYEIAPDRIATIRNGVDCDRLFNPQRYDRIRARRELALPDVGFVLAFVGRLSDEKRPLEFVSCIARLIQLRPVRAIMVGDGPLRTAVDAEIDSTGLKHVISVVPHLDRAEISLVYAAADILMLPSTIEGLPFTALEAMATGCPVAATDVGELSSIIRHGRNGFLVPVDRPAAFVELLAAFANDFSQHEDYRLNARRTITDLNLTLSEMTRRYASLFQQLIGH